MTGNKKIMVSALCVAGAVCFITLMKKMLNSKSNDLENVSCGMFFIRKARDTDREKMDYDDHYYEYFEEDFFEDELDPDCDQAGVASDIEQKKREEMEKAFFEFNSKEKESKDDTSKSYKSDKNKADNQEAE